VKLTVEVPLQASRAAVWASMSTVAGVNQEVAPFVRMTDPTGGAPFDAAPWRDGAPVLWQLLFGVAWLCAGRSAGAAAGCNAGSADRPAVGG
jgi:hypothetical protein